MNAGGPAAADVGCGGECRRRRSPRHVALSARLAVTGLADNACADTMLVFIAKRLLGAVLLLFVMTVVVFVMFFGLAGSRTPVGGGGSLGQGQFETSGSLPEQYVRFVGNVVLHGSLPDSPFLRQPVITVIGHTLPVTASLVIGGTILFLLISFPIALLSALKPRSLRDRGLMFLVLLGFCAHPVWLSLVFSYVFGRVLHWFPLAGYCDLVYDPESTNQCGGPRFWAYHMVLPWLTFALMFTALYARMMRASLLEVMHEDYVRTAVAKGAGSFRVMRSHVLRNALLPVVTMVGMDVGVAFGGTIFIEYIFQLPGLGQLLVLSLTRIDLPMILGIVLVVSITVVIANLIVDISYPLLDPRVRLRGKGDAVAASRGMRRELRARRREVTESAS
jgi:peptide/nickel transport system permease protein